MTASDRVADGSTTTSAPIAAANRSDARRRVAQLLRERAANFVATLEFLDGEATLDDPATGRARVVERGTRIARETALTITKGRALVRLDDGSDLWLAEGARLELNGWSERRRQLRLVAGRALALVASQLGRPFVTSTQHGEILVTGTAFEADARADSLEVSVHHGSVEVSSAGTTARATSGRGIHSTREHAPSVSRLSGTAQRDSLGWLANLSISSSNPAIRPAFRAVAKSAGLPTRPLRGNLTMNKSTSIAAAVSVVAIAAIVFYMTSSSNAAKPLPGTSGTATASAPDGTSFTGAPGTQPTDGGEDVRRFKTADGREFEWHGAEEAPGMERQEVRRAMMEIDGHRIEFDPGDPASIERAIAKLPAAEQDKVREAIKKLPEQHEGPGVLTGEMHGNIQADATDAAAMMKDLIANGMTKEEAQKVVSASLADSIQTRLRKQGSNAKVKTELVSSPDGSDDKVGIMIMVDDDATEDIPGPEGADGATVETSND